MLKDYKLTIIFSTILAAWFFLIQNTITNGSIQDMIYTFSASTEDPLYMIYISSISHANTFHVLHNILLLSIPGVAFESIKRNKDLLYTLTVSFLTIPPIVFYLSTKLSDQPIIGFSAIAFFLIGSSTVLILEDALSKRGEWFNIKMLFVLTMITRIAIEGIGFTNEELIISSIVHVFGFLLGVVFFLGYIKFLDHEWSDKIVNHTP